MCVCDLYDAAGIFLAVVFLVPAVVQDIRKKRISVRYLLAFLSISLLYAAYGIWTGETGTAETLFSELPGIFLLSLAVITERRIGPADGLGFCVIGPFAGGSGCAVILCLSLAGSFVFSVILLAKKRIFSRGALSRTIPFYPFIALGFVLEKLWMFL